MMAANGSTVTNPAQIAPPVQVPPAYKKLVVMLAHMFYSGQCPPAWWVDALEPKKQMSQAEAEMAMFQEKKASQLAREAKRKAQQDTTGLGIVLLTALTERQWVEEEDLARNLNLPPKMVRKAMRFFEQEQLVQREHQKESKRARRKEREMKVLGGLAQAAEDGEEEDMVKGHVITYCALDFPRLYDTVRWRLAMVKKNLEKEARAQTGDMKYKCPNPACGKVFEQMDVFNLMPGGSRAFGGFGAAAGGSQQLLCDICTYEIKMLIDDEGTTMGTMQDKRERQRTARRMLERFDDVMQPLTAQLNACKVTAPPDFMSYKAWINSAISRQNQLKSIADNESAQNPKVQRRPEITQDTKVSVSIAAAEGPAAGSSGSAPGLQLPGMPGMAAAAAPGSRGAGAAVGLPRPSHSAPAARPAAKPLPPWLQSKVHQTASQPAAAKPYPSFLASNHQQQQQQHNGLPSNGGAMEQKVKLDDDIKHTGIKQDPGFKQEVKDELKQDVDAMEQDEWEEVQNTGNGNMVAAAAPVGGLVAEPVMEDDEEDWEEV